MEDNTGFLWKFLVNQVKAAMEDELVLSCFGKYWTDEDEFLFENEDDAEYFADFLKILGFDPHTGYYDPEDDERSGEVDDHTGWYYVDTD